MSWYPDCQREVDAQWDVSGPINAKDGFHGTPAAGVRCAGSLIGETRHESGEVIKQHAHPAATICFVIAGGFQESSAAGSWLCRPLDLVVRPPRYAHSDRVSASSARCLNVSLSPAHAGELHPLGKASFVSSGQMSALRLYAAYRTGQPTEELAEALFRCLRGLSPREEPDPAPPPWLREARARLEGSETRLRIRELARDLGCHPVTFARRFRRCWREAPGAFARQSRCRRAVLAVVREDTPFPVIAHRFGFVDQAHLSRSVTTLIGMPPGRLRALTR